MEVLTKNTGGHGLAYFKELFAWMSVSGKWMLKTHGPCTVLPTSGISQAGLWPAQPACPPVSLVWARAESDTPATLWVTSLADGWEDAHFQVAN